jgi:hypothetical protein
MRSAMTDSILAELDPEPADLHLAIDPAEAFEPAPGSFRARSPVR